MIKKRNTNENCTTQAPRLKFSRLLKQKVLRSFAKFRFFCSFYAVLEGKTTFCLFSILLSSPNRIQQPWETQHPPQHLQFNPQSLQLQPKPRQLTLQPNPSAKPAVLAQKLRKSAMHGEKIEKSLKINVATSEFPFMPASWRRARKTAVI
jgi:hypothetical protein